MKQVVHDSLEAELVVFLSKINSSSFEEVEERSIFIRERKALRISVCEESLQILFKSLPFEVIKGFLHSLGYAPHAL